MKKQRVSFEVVAHNVLNAGGRIAIEWPANCAYWHDKRVRAFVKAYHLEKARRGCAVGMVDYAGVLATNDASLFEE